MAKPLRIVIDLFVNTFGITPPTPENEARSGKVIVAMLVGMLLLLGAIGFGLKIAFSR